MFVILLLLFIALGMPDSILGASWPSIAADFKIDLSLISVFTALAFLASLISTTAYPFLVRTYKFETIINVSVILTIIGSMMFGLFPSLPMLFVSIFVSGIGQGAIDVAVNEYSARYCSLAQINILHGFWGIGVSASSFLVGLTFSMGFNYSAAYILVSLLIFVILLIFLKNKHLFVTKHQNEEEVDNTIEFKKFRLIDMFAPIILFIYSVEFYFGVFITSYLVAMKDFDPALAAFICSGYWIGLTLSRLTINIANKFLASYHIVIIYSFLCIVGSLTLFSSGPFIILIGTMLMGFGFGPIYPTMIHFTPLVVDQEVRSLVISMQVGAFILSVFLSQLLLGYHFAVNGFASFPIIVLVTTIILFILVVGYVLTHIQKIKK